MKNRTAKRQPRWLAFEQLETRAVPAAVPFGAAPEDTAEFMLGDVLVTVVLMESNEQLSSVNDNSETWTSTSIAAVKQKVQEAMQWWEETLAQITNRHELNFIFDFTFADQPVRTRYEPITQPATAYQVWVYDFLKFVGFNQTGDFSTDIRQFNHFQREGHDTHWAFTIFVVNDEHDADGQFRPGSQPDDYPTAFAFAGGRFLVTPAARPASTLAHETGHMFWALDEFFGASAGYNSFRGYYNTQNRNAWNNPTPGFQQVPSLMETGDCETGGGLRCTAWQNHISSPSSLEMVGWRDSDGDGVFDVLDVPLELTGSGVADLTNRVYRFNGHSAVKTLSNQNTAGLGNDITINTVSRAEYRINGGEWLVAAEYDAYQVDIQVDIPFPAGASQIEIRTVDRVTGIRSSTFVDRFQPSAWHNPNQALDVNNSGSVSPIDVLHIINDLNENGPRRLTNETPPPYFDVNDDGFVTSQDALMVINHLNSVSSINAALATRSTSPPHQSLGEGEASTSTVQGAGGWTSLIRFSAVDRPLRHLAAHLIPTQQVSEALHRHAAYLPWSSARNAGAPASARRARFLDRTSELDDELLSALAGAWQTDIGGLPAG